MSFIGALRAGRYFGAVVTLYTKRKGKFVSEDILAQRFDICKQCPHFKIDRCLKCGCCVNAKEALNLHFNKLAYPDEECPDGRWNKATVTETPYQ